MKKYLNILKKCPLFLGLEDSEILSLLSYLKSKKQSVEKNEMFFNLDEVPKYLGIVLSGSVHIIQEDYWGTRTILSIIKEGDLFAESFTCAKVPMVTINIVPPENSEVLLIDCNKLLESNTLNTSYYSTLINNLISILATKNIMLTRKISHITKYSIRERVLSYLSEYALVEKSSSFKIPFNRQELADYLSVDRSALSKNLCKMRDDGIIAFNKNHFTLLKDK